MLVQICAQVLHFGVLAPRKIQMQNRMHPPLLLQTLHREAPEKLLPPAEIRLHGRYQKALAEAPRTAQEVVLAGRSKTVNLRGLVNIDKPALADLFKILYSNRVQHGTVLLYRDKDNPLTSKSKPQPGRKRCPADKRWIQRSFSGERPFPRTKCGKDTVSPAEPLFGRTELFAATAQDFPRKR